MPARLQPLIPEAGFLQLREECRRARSNAQLEAIIRHYNELYQLNGALRIISESENNGGFLATMADFLGMSPERVLVFDLAVLNQSRVTNPYSGLQQAEVVVVSPPVQMATATAIPADCSVPVVHAQPVRVDDPR